MARRPTPLVPLARILIPGLVVVVALSAGSAGFAAWKLGETESQGALQSRLEARAQVWSLVQQQRYRRLELIARTLASDEVLLGYLDENDAVLDTIEQFQNHLVFDLAVVLDGSGAPVASAGVVEAPIPAGGWPDSDETLTGTQSRDGRLWHVVSIPLVRDYQRLGRLVVGLLVDEPLLRHLRSEDVAAFVRLGDGASPSAAGGGEDVPAMSPALLAGAARSPVATPDGASWVRAVPLRSVDGTDQDHLVLVAATAPVVAPFRNLVAVALGGGLFGLVLGGLGLWGVARSLERPLRALRRVLECPPDAETEWPRLPGEAGALADAVRRRAGRDAARAGLAARSLARLQGAPPPVTEDPRAARIEKVAVLGVELESLEGPRRAGDAEASLEVAARSLASVADEIEARGGRWVGPCGPRVLGVFEDAGLLRALGAAAALGGRLGGEGESSRVAVVLGEALVGSFRTEAGVAPALIGTLTRRLDGLLREVGAGEIAFTPLEIRALTPALERSGVEPTTRKGILGHRPFHVLTADGAARVAGDRAASATRSVVRHLPGRRLEMRWEVLGEAARGPWGPRLKALDRETGGTVRIDLIASQAEADPVLRDRLAGVARRIRDVRTPHVAPLLHVGSVDGRAAMVSPWVDGSELGSLATGDWTDAERIRLAEDLALGLVAIHERGLAHGGIGARTAVLDLEGRGCWIDAGLAPAFGDDDATDGRSGLAPSPPPDLPGDLEAFGRLLAQVAGEHPGLREIAHHSSGAEGSGRWERATQVLEALQRVPQRG